MAKNINPKLIPNEPNPEGIGMNLQIITTANNNDIIINDLISLKAFNDLLKNDIWNGVLYIFSLSYSLITIWSILLANIIINNNDNIINEAKNDEIQII